MAGRDSCEMTQDDDVKPEEIGAGKRLGGEEGSSEPMRTVN